MSTATTPGPPHLGDLRSEDAFLELIDSFFPNSHHRLPLGRGDDCAVINCKESLCVSSDLFLQDVHFRMAYFAPEDIGYKALAVNISDIAAMGAKPLGFVLNLMAPGHLERGFWEAFFRGMAELAAEHDLYLAGGDLSVAPYLGVVVTIWGERLEGGRLLRRVQARPGDVLFLVGEIGLARLGLTLLEGGVNPKTSKNDSTPADYPIAVQAHLRPFMQVSTATALSRTPEVRGMMDVSDGLARDLPRFLGPELGCALSLPLETLHPELRLFARKSGMDAAEWAVLGGEDYALLGVVAARDWDMLREKNPAVRRLGDVTKKPGIHLNEKQLRSQGFDHFSR
ncbi:thiamine-phosphate kinase [Desulfonatronum sp. SC1]|uniref:thiamine-phosphate kinase n=1 Tax=Desulfonatronum sp. SC1 TaxID=2109626 RepID=UPI000D30B09A|nr:thiamine-phosphate kinase [Desulfonatronum sp. SC1]PTN36106.1 thiamine-phosphate kinase [Desulfonatronum sp. SC1]